jgi:dCMP deaminase
MPNFYEYFCDMLHCVSSKSKDPSTKVGAIITGPNNELRSTGYNGFPAGSDDDYAPWYERDLKLKVTEHAERNAIYLAARHGTPLDGCTIYVSTYPCCDCARAIIQTGIKKVIINTEHKSFNNKFIDRWKKDLDISIDMLCRVGVGVYLYSNGMVREIETVERVNHDS